jgi:hypothetical protein
MRVTLMAMCLAGAVQADEAPMRAQEQLRLDGFQASAGKALLQALSAGTLRDVDQLQEALAGAPLPPLATTLAGEWDCRTFKLGGIATLTVYAQFKCVFEPDGTAFTFEKLTGSQRTMGRVTMQDRTMIYLGVGYVADELPMAYADLPPEDFGDGVYQPQVGIVEQTGPNTARILFPAPINESDFDLLYLTRSDNAQIFQPNGD